MRRVLLVLSPLIALAVVPVAVASTQERTADATVAYVSAHTVEGWADTGTLTEDEAAMSAGARIRVGCANQSILAARALIRRGILARIVEGASLDPAAPEGDYGHTVMEAYVDGRWQVYDVTFNVKPVLPDGRGMTVERYAARLAANLPVRFVRLSNDDGVDWTDYPTALADMSHTRTEIALGVYGFDKLRLQVLLHWADGKHGWVFRGSQAVGNYVSGRWPWLRWLNTAAYAAVTGGATAYDRGILTW